MHEKRGSLLITVSDAQHGARRGGEGRAGGCILPETPGLYSHETRGSGKRKYSERKQTAKKEIEEIGC